MSDGLAKLVLIRVKGVIYQLKLINEDDGMGRLFLYPFSCQWPMGMAV